MPTSWKNICQLLVLSFCILIQLSNSVVAQTEPELAIHFLSNDKLANYNFNDEAFLDYSKRFVDKFSELMASETEKRDIAVLQTYHKEKAPTISIHARPALDEKRAKEILTDLKAIPSTRSKYTDYSLVYIANIDGGHADKEAAFVPELISPAYKEKEVFEAASLEEKASMIREWSYNIALPVLAEVESEVDPQFTGVRSMGALLSKTDFSRPQAISKLTAKNSDYWRAFVEMATGDQTIVISMICMYTSQGQFDHANNYLQLLPFFSEEDIFATYLSEELSWRMTAFNKALAEKVNEGIQLHDRGKYDSAINIYKEVLKAHPNSAFAKYEIYFSENAKAVAKNPEAIDDRSAWDKAKIQIFSDNPLYDMDVHASTGEEAWLLFRRQEMKSLFKSQEKVKKDIIEYADIALDLKAYDFAAHVYWWVILSIPKEEYEGRNIIMHFLYCLDKLRETTIKENFKGNHAKEFKKIEKERTELMKKSTMYKAFKEK